MGCTVLYHPQLSFTVIVDYLLLYIRLHYLIFPLSLPRYTQKYLIIRMHSI